jgi:methionyl-tRNA synthetase
VVEFKEKIVVTSGLPYANGELHLGHVASTYLPADIFARYCRLKGRDVVFVCATDDFGTPILIKAEKEGKRPEEFVGFWNKKDREGFDALGISLDVFDRTSSKENIEFTQKFFLSLYKKGLIFKKAVELPYCEKCKKFLPDRYVKGACPYCGAEEQYSDGCEKCGRIFEPTKIISPHCAICGTAPVKRSSEHYFFKLSAFSGKLKEWMGGNENLQTEVKNYVLRWIEEGLLDWDITRDLNWGVPIPLKETAGKVLYGWFDNHLCYISSLVKHLAKKKVNGKKFWNSSRIFHFIGKDIVYHHYLFLPAVRIGEGSFKLPDFIPVRGHLLLQGRKFSKSRDWYVGLDEFLSAFPADYLRYYLSALTHYSQADVNFDWKDFQARINNELVAAIGNFIHRTLTFIDSKLGGKVPKPGKLDGADMDFQKRIESVAGEVASEIERNEFSRALKKIVEFSASCNQYFQKREPWKNSPQNCLYLCINAVRTLAVLLEPYLPFAAEDLWKQLSLAGSVHSQKWQDAGELKIKANHKISKPHILFRKIEDKEIEGGIVRLKSI